MHLTAIYKLRADSHDRALLATALARWRDGYAQAMAQMPPDVLLPLVRQWTGKDGKERWGVDAPQLDTLAKAACREAQLHLHSSARGSLIVAVKEVCASYLALYAEWLQSGRKGPKPQPPTMAPGSIRMASARWEAALDASEGVSTLAEETAWRAEVTRAARQKLLPMYFGSMQAGINGGGFAGLIRRADGKLFAMLQLWPQGDAHGEPLRRAENRQDRGTLRNLRAADKGETFRPTERSRCAIMCPLEYGHGHESLFHRRAVPQSCDLVARDGEYYLHVAFRFPDHAPREELGTVLALRRGIANLASALVVGEDGRVLHRQQFAGKALVQLVTEMGRVRALRQQKGQPTRGDRRVSRVAEHHLYSLGHQVIDLACQWGAREIVLLADPQARSPQRFLAYKHWSQLHEILLQLCAEAGLPEPQERKIYGKWHTCLRCGWAPGDPVRVENPQADQCGGCGQARDPEWHLPHLLAVDTLRFRARNGKKDVGKAPPLGEYVRTLRPTG
ncbi:MAG: hypothetical protein Q7L55_06010 [Actinomycetota bacterium]|nr:hypothetical protein [Actinomycetota bacterium]